MTASRAPVAPQTAVARRTIVPGLDHAIGPGMNGPEVLALQERLRQTGFDPGPSDGVFGPATERSVWAYEKLVAGVDATMVTGIVTPERWSEINRGVAVEPRRSVHGTHLEVLLPEQVAVLYVDDVATLVTHISSGSGETWCDVVLVDNDDGTQSEQGICGVAVTPGGVFHFERRVAGWRNSKLGRLFNPVYFNYGIAVHGASNVPARPVSHGCVRIPMHIAEYFPSLVRDGDAVYVFDGVEEPERYGAQLPVFDSPDPTFTATTAVAPTTARPPSSTSEVAHSDVADTAHVHDVLPPSTSTPAVPGPAGSTAGSTSSLPE